MKNALLLLPGLLACAVAQANDALTLPDTIVTASRVEQPRESALAANTVFDRDDIERLQARSVPELLRRVPGVQLNSNGGVLSYFVRGGNTAQTLVLVDGQRIASATTGGARLDYLNIDNIERVEVVRGPRSAVYGADAIGGVIQIFTRQGQAGLQPTIRLGVGSNHTFERSVDISGGNENSRFILGATLNETEGFDLTEDNLGNDRDNDGQRTKSYFARFDHTFNEDWSAGLSVNDQSGKSEFDDAYEFNPANPENQFRVRGYAGYLQGQLSSNWRSRLELGSSEDRNKTVGSRFNDGQITTERHSASWLNYIDLSADQQLNVGADWQRDKLDATNGYTKDRRENIGLFAQHSWAGERISTELGVRHDDNQHFGEHDTWNAALSIPSGDSQQWIVSYATAFRAPTFNDLYAPPGWGGNPDLDPERSRTFELQWRADLLDSQWEASLYRTDVKDLIVWDSSTFQMNNVDEARINGLELAVNTDFMGWASRTSVSFIDPRDRQTGKTLQLRAKRTLTSDLDRQFGDFGVGATWALFSERFANAANSSTLAGYGTLDLRANWQATASTRLDLKVSNVLDRDYHLGTYQRATGPWPAPSIDYSYKEQGRAALLSVTWTPQL